MKGAWRPPRPPCIPISFLTRSSRIRRLASCLRYRRIGNRRNAADSLCAGRKLRSRDQEHITLRRSCTTSHAGTRKGIPVLVRPRETIRECLQEGHDLILLPIRQAQFAGGHVNVVPDLGPRPAGNPLDSSGRAVSGCDVVRKRGFVTSIVEMYKLLQALDVAVVKELLLKVRPGGLGGGTLRRCHSHIARRRHLHLAVDRWCEFSPSNVRVGGGTETASEEGPHAQVSIAEAERIGSEPEGIRRGLIIESIPGIQRQTLVGRAEAGEQRRVRSGDRTRIRLAWLQSGSSSVNVARVAIAFALEQVVTGHLVCCHRVVAFHERVEFRRKSADLHGLLV